MKTTRQTSRMQHKGFTLIEVMITVAILAIIVSLALASYQGSIRKSRRSEAKVALSNLAQRLERCLSQFGTYNDTGCAITSPQNSANGFYQITVTRTATTYALVAAPAGAQGADTACVSFRLDEVGHKTATISGGAAATNCW